jgi:DNA-binding XRE family transcriptional regulator
MKTRLRYLRRHRALTQLELAELAGVSNQTIVNIERYGKEPAISTIRKLAKALEITTSELFTDDLAQSDGTDDDETPTRNKVQAA